MIAEYERAQILERTRRARLEKARRGEFISWAYRCYECRYLPTRPGFHPKRSLNVRKQTLGRVPLARG
jgi:DNA invertase Pin-like site-specific DNA recombinase